MIWLILFLAGVLEVFWALGLKLSEGFSHPLMTLATLVAMVLSVFLLGLAMRSLPVATAYAIWVGIGVIGTAVLGQFVLAQPVNWVGALSICLILTGIVGLKMST